MLLIMKGYRKFLQYPSFLPNFVISAQNIEDNNIHVK